jgi:O-acetyl-ADP-ribose deacetylase
MRPFTEHATALGVYRWPKDDAVTQALTALHAEPTTVEVIRLVLFDDQTRHAAERIYQAFGDGR